MVLIASLVFSLVAGCLPCSQLLQQLSAKKSCCTKSGNCKMPKQPTEQKCDLTLSASEHVLVPDAPQLTPALESAVFEAVEVAVNHSARTLALPLEHSPPDLFLLHSSILI